MAKLVTQTRALRLIRDYYRGRGGESRALRIIKAYRSAGRDPGLRSAVAQIARTVRGRIRRGLPDTYESWARLGWRDSHLPKGE